MPATETVYNLDNSFLENVASYLKDPSNWRLKPDSLSPAQCARYGWRCVGKDLITCTVCKESLCAHLPPFGSLSYEECQNEIITSLKKKHKQGCPLLHVPKSEKYIFLHPLSKKEAQSYFQNNWESLSSLEHALPTVESAHLQLSQEQLRSLIPSSSSNPNQNWEVEKARTLLSLTGWHKDGPTSIKCLRCQRTLELKAFFSMHPPSAKKFDPSHSNGTKLDHPISSLKSEASPIFDRTNLKHGHSPLSSPMKTEHLKAENRASPQKVFKKQDTPNFPTREEKISLLDACPSHNESDPQKKFVAMVPSETSVPTQEALHLTKSAENIKDADNGLKPQILSVVESQGSENSSINQKDTSCKKFQETPLYFPPPPSCLEKKVHTPQINENSSPIKQPLPGLQTDSANLSDTTYNSKYLTVSHDVLSVAEVLIDEVAREVELSIPSLMSVKDSLSHNLPFENENSSLSIKGHSADFPMKDTKQMNIEDHSDDTLHVNPDIFSMESSAHSENAIDLNPQDSTLPLPNDVTTERHTNLHLTGSEEGCLSCKNDITSADASHSPKVNSEQKKEIKPAEALSHSIEAQPSLPLNGIHPQQTSPYKMQNEVFRKRQAQDGEASSAKKPKVVLKSTLDPLYEHRSWCSWVIASLASSKPGWKVFLDCLFPPDSSNQDTLNIKWARALEAIDSWNQPHI